MLKHSFAVGLGILIALAATTDDSAAQGRQTGTIRGTTQDLQQLVLPGVDVVVRSDSLQGVRSTTSSLNGTYELPGLPPGDYAVTFELDGFGAAEEIATVPLGGTVAVNATMHPARVAEAVQVIAVVPTPIESTETSHNLTADDIDRLPVGRDIFRIAELAPGLSDNAPNDGQLTINGGFGYDNAFLIDGVDVNDNIFGTANNLFIEDAIEETQVLTSGISAEYGRFSGGVVNAITKSGSNTLSGSFRTNLYKPNWTGRTPFEVDNGIERSGPLADNSTYETTVGGPIVEDRLWFYYANRVERSATVETFDESGVGYDRALNNDRNLFKLTGSLAPGHQLEGSYMRNSTDDTGPTFGFTIDPAGLRTRQVPNDLMVATYRGAATSNVFAELQVSRRRFGFRNNGGTQTGIVESPFLTLTQAFGHYNAPYFDANDPQNRDNLQFTGNVTYYVNGPSAGTHSIKGGFEHFTSTLQGGNSQTATGYVFSADYAVDGAGAPMNDADGRFVPIFSPGATQLQQWSPLRGGTLDIRTLSGYINDNWQLNKHFTFNLGVRAEQVTSQTTDDVGGLSTSAIVPRLAAAYDPTGDGRYTIQATYGHYAGRYGEAQFSQNSNVGSPDLLLGVYTGPAGQGRDFAPGFDPDNYLTVFGLFPVRNVFFANDLSSPITKEFTLGGGAAIGRRGYTKVTYIHRTMGSFVEDFFTLDGGSRAIIEDEQFFGLFTSQIFRNTDMLERSYDAIELLGHLQVMDNLVVDGSVTVQINNDGNFSGEARNQPGLSSRAFDYPEITPAERYFPTGRLAGFQKHKTRVWGIYNLDLESVGGVSIAGLWRYDSGSVYDIAASGVGTTAVQQTILDSLGYFSGPSAGTVYFGEGRGSRTHDGYGLVDMSVQYSIPVWQSLSPWFKLEVYNLLNNGKQIGANTSVVVDPDGPVDEFGIPTTYIEGPNFGEATSTDHYPHYLPNLSGLRTIRLAMGFRW